MDEITSTAEALKRVAGVDLNLGLASVITVCLNAVGAYLKSAEWFPTRFIPFAVIALAFVAYPSLAENFKPANWIIGIGIGFVAIGAHQGVRTVKEMFVTQKQKSDSQPQP